MRSTPVLRAISACATVVALGSPAAAQDDRCDTRAPATAPRLATRDLAPDDTPPHDVSEHLRRVRWMAPRTLSGRELAEWIHGLVDAHLAIERHWAARAPGDEVAARARDAARDAAIIACARLEHDAPDYERIDDVRAELASALERAGQEARAEAVHRRITTPALATFARIRLGELALSRGDLDGAREHFAAAARLPQSGRAPPGLALYLLAWTEHRLGHDARAIDGFVAAAERGVDEVRRHALADLALPLARLRRAPAAMSTVRGLARTPEERISMTSSLLTAYVAHGREAEARALARRARTAAIGSCDWTAIARGADPSDR